MPEVSPSTKKQSVLRWPGIVVKSGWLGVALGALTFWWYGVGFVLLLLAAVGGLSVFRQSNRRPGMVLFWFALGTAGAALMILLVLLSGSEVTPAKHAILPPDPATRQPR